MTYSNSAEKLTQLRESKQPKPKPLSVIELLDQAQQCRELVAKDAQERQHSQQQATPVLSSTDEAIARRTRQHEQTAAAGVDKWKQRQQRWAKLNQHIHNQ